MSYFVYQGKNIYYTSEGGGMPMLFFAWKYGVVDDV